MRLRYSLLLISIVTLSSPPARSQTTGLDELAALAADGRCAQAFELMKSIEFEMSIDTDFNLLYAHCALELGETGLAMLAIDRVLALDPGNETARFQLAQAYYTLNLLDGARREFELLLSLNPTPSLRDNIGQYLDTIAAAQPGESRSVNGYLEAGLGNDSNVTGGTSNDTILLPGLGQDFRPVANELEDGDSYGNIAAGIDGVLRLNQGNSLYAGADLSARAHGDRDDQDYLLTVLRAGYGYAWRNQSLRLGLGVGNWRFDGANYQYFDSVELEWRATISRRSQFGILGQHNRYRYQQQVDEVLDFDDSRLRFSLSRLFGKAADTILSISTDIGQEDDVNDRDDGQHKYYGIRLSGQMSFNNELIGFLLIESQNGDYDRINPLFSEKRSESQNQIAAGLIWSFRENLSLRTTLAISEIESNLSLYDTTDEDVSIVLRRDFK